MRTAKPIVNDMPVGGWTDRCPAAVRPYLKLMRLDRPIGTWLLLLPCWWSATLAAPSPSARLLGFCALFGIGAVIMRGAGCAINDIATAISTDGWNAPPPAPFPPARSRSGWR